MQEGQAPESIWPLLTQICSLNHARTHALLHEIGLYYGQPLVLRALWDEEGLTQTALAEKLHRAPATITHALQRMERAGFVERRPDPADQRVSRVYLSDAGHAVRDRVQAVWLELEEIALRGLDPHDVATLRRCLDAIRINLRSADGQPRGRASEGSAQPG